MKCKQSSPQIANQGNSWRWNNMSIILKLLLLHACPWLHAPSAPELAPVHLYCSWFELFTRNTHNVIHILTGLSVWNCTTEMQNNHGDHFDMIIPEQHFWEAMLRRTSVHLGDAILDWIAFEDTTLRRKTRKSPRCNSAACCFRRAAGKLKQKFSFTALILDFDWQSWLLGTTCFADESTMSSYYMVAGWQMPTKLCSHSCSSARQRKLH